MISYDPTTKAEQIAKDIAEAVDLLLFCNISIEECSNRTKILWKEARALGLHEVVDEILQNNLLNDTKAAMLSKE